MFAAKEIQRHNKVGENPHPLFSFLKPTIDNLIEPQTKVIRAALQLNQSQSTSELSTSKLIPLLDRVTKEPTINNSYPVYYQREEIALLHLTTEQNTSQYIGKTSIQSESTERLTKTISLLIKRYQSSAYIHKYLGKGLSIAGHSEEALKLDSFIEKAGNASCPVVIVGSQGCEKLAIACAIHYNSTLKTKPFVEFNCASRNSDSFEEKLRQCFEMANGGTVFLNAIDKLPLEQQVTLTDLLAITSLRIDKSMNALLDSRILVSTSQPLTQLVLSGGFSESLFEKLNYLNITVPTISQRKEDIPYIVKSLQSQYKQFPEQDFSAEAKRALCEYSWPNNHRELKHTVAKLLALSPSNPVCIEDIKSLAPEIVAFNSLTNNKPNSNSGNIDLIQSLKSNNFCQFDHIHKRLKNALIFISENYLSPISLKDLSEQVHISPSHLSYLFKQHLGQTIKQIITELRIIKAQELIEQSPQTLITNIALDVGFGDLSHFEKMFKRYTKLTPREYKSKIKQRRLALS